METLKAIHSLHSTHGNFSPDREVPESDLEKVLEASVRAATASTRQSYSIIVVRDREKIRRVAQYDATFLAAQTAAIAARDLGIDSAG